MIKSNIDVIFATPFLCSLKFLLFHRIEYPMSIRCVHIYMCVYVCCLCVLCVLCVCVCV